MVTQNTSPKTEKAAQRPSQDILLAHQLVQTYYPELLVNNELPEAISKTIYRHIDYLRAGYSDLTHLQGKKILDVACGSRIVPDNAEHQWDPWMPRLLTLLGAVPHGVDLFKQTNESFESTVKDLVEKDALACFKTNSFDAYYLSGFPNRISLQRIHTGPIGWEALRTNMEYHLDRVLKPEGVIIRSFSERTEEFVLKNLRLPGFATATLIW
jgi:hypothetical protein